jgi:ubiquinone biosynthesis accessory factor UbiK
MDPKLLDELARRLAEAVPSGLRELQQDLEKNFRATLTAGFSRLDLVTREEFDVQVAVLARTRAKVDALEKQVLELERIIKARSAAEPPPPEPEPPVA